MLRGRCPSGHQARKPGFAKDHLLFSVSSVFNLLFACGRQPRCVETRFSVAVETHAVFPGSFKSGRLATWTLQGLVTHG